MCFRQWNFANLQHEKNLAKPIRHGVSTWLERMSEMQITHDAAEVWISTGIFLMSSCLSHTSTIKSWPLLLHRSCKQSYNPGGMDCLQWKGAERKWIRWNLTGLSCRAPLEITRCFGYIWIHADAFVVDAFVIVWIHLVHLHLMLHLMHMYWWELLGVAWPCKSQSNVRLAGFAARARTSQNASLAPFVLWYVDGVWHTLQYPSCQASCWSWGCCRSVWVLACLARSQVFLSLPNLLTLFKCFSRHSGYNRSKTPWHCNWRSCRAVHLEVIQRMEMKCLVNHSCALEPSKWHSAWRDFACFCMTLHFSHLWGKEKELEAELVALRGL